MKVYTIGLLLVIYTLSTTLGDDAFDSFLERNDRTVDMLEKPRLITTITTKQGYKFVTKDLGNSKFKCDCYLPDGRKIWTGACQRMGFGFLNCV